MFKIREFPEGYEKGDNHLGLGTRNRRNGIHVWIGHHEEIEDEDGEKTTIFMDQSVILNRKDAQNLVDEINERLF